MDEDHTGAEQLLPAVPHTLGVPPPPHVCGAVQLPQEALRALPQMSVPLTVPQFLPRRAQKAASVSVQVPPQTLGVPPPPQVSGAVQEPHEVTVRAALQLSVPLRLPQFFPRREQNAAFVSGVHPASPNIWISVTWNLVVAPLFAVKRSRYCWNAVVFATAYVFVWKRAAPANWPDRVSRVVQPVFEPAVHVPWHPWSVQSLGSRVGTSLPVVIV